MEEVPLEPPRSRVLSSNPTRRRFRMTRVGNVSLPTRLVPNRSRLGQVVRTNPRWFE